MSKNVFNKKCIKKLLEEDDVASKLKDADTARKLTIRDTNDVLFQVAISNMIAGLTTQAKNITSSATSALNRVPETLIATTLSKIERNPESRMYYRAAVAEMNGMMSGFMHGFLYIGRRLNAIRTGESVEDTLLHLYMPTALGANTRVELQRNLLTGKRFGFTGWKAFAADTMGFIISYSGKSLNAADTMFKIIHYQGEMYKNAITHAIEHGKPTQIDKALKRYVKDQGYETIKKGIHSGEYHTFTDEPTSKLAKMMASHEANSSPVLRWVAPFRRTIIRLLDYSIERSPAAIFRPEFYRAVRGELGTAERYNAISRMALGSFIVFGPGWAFREHITGAPPRNPIQRDLYDKAGWEPWSLKIGDTYISLDALGHIGYLLRMVAITNDLISNSPSAMLKEAGAPDAPGPVNEASNEITRLLGAGITSVAEVAYSSHWLRDVARALDDVHLAVKNHSPKYLLKWVERKAAVSIPVLGNRMYINQVTERRHPAVVQHREIGDYLKYVTQDIYEASKPYTKRFNLFGDTVKYEHYFGEGGITPAYDPSDSENIIASIFKKLDVEVPELQGTIKFPLPSGKSGSTQMTQREWHLFQALAGKGIPGITPPIKEALTRMITSGTFNTQTKYGKGVMIRQLVSQYRQNARTYIKEHPDLDIHNRIERTQAMELKYLGVKP